MVRQIALVPAYVLHTRLYRESSLIVELLTSEQGRISAVARGARRTKRANPFQPFQLLHVNWSGRGELVSLNQFEAASTACRLTGDALITGFYINELLMKICHQYAPVPGIFQHYQQLLTVLATAFDESVLRLFERDLLEHLGYGLELSKEVESHSDIDEHEQYYYQLERGPVKSLYAQDNSLPISGAALIALRTGKFTAETLKESKKLLRLALSPLLNHKPLKTRTVYRDLVALI